MKQIFSIIGILLLIGYQTTGTSQTTGTTWTNDTTKFNLITPDGSGPFPVVILSHGRADLIDIVCIQEIFPLREEYS